MAPKRIRIELDETGARALHAALTSVLASEALAADQASAARGVLEQLDRRVPEWVAEDPEQTVLAALAEAEAQGRGALAEEELIATLGAGGASVSGLLDRMVDERLLQRTERDGRIWLAAGRRRQTRRRSGDRPRGAGGPPVRRAPPRPLGAPPVGAGDRPARRRRLRGARRRAAHSAALLEPSDTDELELTDDGATLARERWAARSPTPHWRIPAPALPYRELPIEAAAADRRCPSAGCEGSVSARSAAWKALVRDGSVEWTCPECSRTWLLYLQAYNETGPRLEPRPPPVEGDHNRPHWRSGR